MGWVIDQLTLGLESVLPALVAWCQRPWFLRVWMVQESALNIDTVFRCGRKTIGAETLISATTLPTPRLEELANTIQLVANKTGPKLLQDLFEPSSSQKLCLAPVQFYVRRRYESSAMSKQARASTLLISSRNSMSSAEHM